MTERGKGLFHTTLAVAGVLEYFSCQSRVRKFLVGVCTGWHIYAAYDHFSDSIKQREYGSDYPPEDLGI